jgi:hypothetical protein
VLSWQAGISLEGNMASKKAKPAQVARKTPAREPAAERRTVGQDAVSATGGLNPGRLLREAAWSRMFGRVDAKNPFAR